MSITIILMTLLLSGFGNMQPNGVHRGGPVTATPTTSGIGGITVDEVMGGGPVG